MRSFKSSGRQQPVAQTSTKKLQVTTEFQSDYPVQTRYTRSQPPMDQAEMKRNLQAMASEYERTFQDRVYLAFESEGPLPSPQPQWAEDDSESELVRSRQDRYEEDRAVQVEVQQYMNTPQRYTGIKASPIPQQTRSRKSSLPPSNVSTPYRPPSQESTQVLSFLKTSTDTLAQALSSLGGFTSNMEQLMSNLTKTTTALHSSIRSLEASQQPSPGYPHRTQIYADIMNSPQKSIRPLHLLSAFEAYQAKRFDLESRFVEDMKGIEARLEQFADDLQRKMQAASEGAEGKKDQLQEIANHAERLMAALRTKKRAV